MGSSGMAAQQHGGAVRRGGEIAQGTRSRGYPKISLYFGLMGYTLARIAEALHVPGTVETRPAVGGCADHRDGRGVNKGIQFPRGFFLGRLLCQAVRECLAAFWFGTPAVFLLFTI